jgi:hypothetical protein
LAVALVLRLLPRRDEAAHDEVAGIAADEISFQMDAARKPLGEQARDG